MDRVAVFFLERARAFLARCPRHGLEELPDASSHLKCQARIEFQGIQQHIEIM